MTQHIIVLCVVALCVAYVVYRIVYAVRNAHGRCYGCQLKDVCNKYGNGKKAISPRQSKPGRGQSDFPYSASGPRGNSGTGRHVQFQFRRHSEKFLRH